MEALEATAYKEIIEKLLDAEKLRNCFECGICTASCPMAEILGDQYNPRCLLEKIVMNPKAALSSEEIWFCGWCYRCHKRCPQALKIPEIFLHLRSAAVEQGYMQTLENALQKIVANVPLPLVATLVCLHPERAGINNDKVLQKIDQMREELLKTKKRQKGAKPPKARVAVIGSGPAGLTVACELVRKGYGVTILEALSELGGMLRKGIPEPRLPKHVLTRELQFIKNLGVEMKTRTRVGKDISFCDLQSKGYKATFVAPGAHKTSTLKIEGEDLEGVVHALDFLWDSNSHKKMRIGKNVVVIGGGKSAVDAAITARCLGAKEVTVLYRRSQEEMPASLWEVKQAEEEGVKMELLVSPKKFFGENGRVSAIECVRMQLGEPDETGRRKAIPMEGSEFTRETDMVILAIGENPDLAFLPEDVEGNDDGTIWVNPITMETSMPGVFAGGDAVTGPASVIEAIRDGKRAAKSIENYLKSLKEA